MEEFVSIVRELFIDKDIKTIVEVGSLNGADAIYFKEQFPAARVVAIEGLKENFDLYMKDLSRIECLNVCIADYNGRTTYHVKNTNGIHGIFNRGEAYGTASRTVECYRLDSLFTASIDMMKIDVEGATYEVLVGMGGLLKQVKVMHIETEDYEFFKGQKFHKDVAELLDTNGFSVVRQSSVRIGPGCQYDSVWVNNEYLDS